MRAREPIYQSSHLHPEFCQSFALRMLRADFLAQPPAKQAETLERARRVAKDHPQSYLARHFDTIYGGHTIKTRCDDDQW